MTDQEIIIEVAKLDGFEVTEKQTQFNTRTIHFVRFTGHPLEQRLVLCELPSYLTSRDAIIPVIENWFKEDWSIGNRLVDNLFELHSCPEGSADLTDVYNTSAQVTCALLLSTPRQLSIALLKATRKWEE